MTLIIKYIATVYTETGELKHVSTAPGGDLPEEGIVEGSSPEEEIVYVPSTGFEAVDLLTMLHEYRRKYGNWVHKGAPPTKYYEWNIQAEEWQQNWNTFLAELREERNRRLHICDWTQTLDNPMEETVKASWRNYRNSLRNFPTHFQTPDPTIRSLEDIEWPALPDGTILEILVF
jgi:hypothetical protein